MKVKSFFINSGPYTLSEVVQNVLSDYVIPDSFSHTTINGIATLSESNSNDLTYLSDKNYINGSDNIQAAACFIRQDLIDILPSNVIPIITPNPEYAIIVAINMLYQTVDNVTDYSISKDAVIADNVELRTNIRIESGAVIKSGVVIGQKSAIDSNTVVGKNVVIGENVIIGSNCSIQHCYIGDNVVIHPGTRIGQDGFGYGHTGSNFIKFPHIGRVIIQDNVEIGANSTIDRGSLNDTVIGEGTKIDNLVHIAHNVIVGRNCGLAGQVGISGSVKIGDNVILGGQVGVIPHRKIGDNAQVAAGSGIMHNVQPNQKVAGRPHREIDKYLNEIKTLTRLSRK